MRKGTVLKVLLGILGMAVLILDGQTAAYGIRCGIEICLKTLIPSLFPLFVISGMITGSVAGHSIPFLRQVCCLCRVPSGSEPLVAVGFLSGYPVGAKNVHDVLCKGRISEENAQRLALLCSNAGPAFIFGILGPMFSGFRWSLALWVLQSVSGILTLMLFPGGEPEQMSTKETQSVNPSSLIFQSTKSMVSVCAWVTVFRMVLEFLNRWVFWLLPDWLRILMTGLLELSNGCLELGSLSNEYTRFLLASVLLLFGGLCVFLQIQSVFPELDAGFYLKGKVFQSILCLLLTVPVYFLLTGKISDFGSLLIIAGMLVSLVFLCRFRKKEVAIR